MRQGGLDQLEVSSDVEPKRVVPLLVADFGEVTMGHLDRRVAHQHIDPAEFGSGPVDYRSAVSRIGQVARY